VVTILKLDEMLGGFRSLVLGRGETQVAADFGDGGPGAGYEPATERGELVEPRSNSIKNKTILRMATSSKVRTALAKVLRTNSGCYSAQVFVDQVAEELNFDRIGH
jgi:hypothetical protein